MSLHRALSSLVAASALSLGLAGTSVAGTRDLVAVATNAGENYICIVNNGDDPTLVNPMSADNELALVLMLPDSADAEKISVSLPPDWTVRARELQKERHALVISLSPARPLAVKGQSIAACFELVGIRTDELGPIGLATSVRAQPETDPRGRR